MSILTHSPIWVWPLLVLLLWLGLRASRPRQMRPIMIYLTPMLGLLALRSTATLPAAGAAWSGLALGAVLGLLGGYALQGRWLISRTGPKVDLAGEWLTLAAMMVLYFTNFALGALRATAPELLAQPSSAAIIAMILGLASGSFAGRAIRTARFMRGSGADDAAGPRSSSPA